MRTRTVIATLALTMPFALGPAPVAQEPPQADPVSKDQPPATCTDGQHSENCSDVCPGVNQTEVREQLVAGLKAREWFTQYGLDIEGGLIAWDNSREESQRFFDQFLHYSRESLGLSLGLGGGVARFDFDGRPTDRVRGEFDLSYQIAPNAPQKVRALLYASYADIDVADESLLESQFNPTGSRTIYGTQFRWREQTEGGDPELDSIFYRPQEFRDAALGYQYIRDRSEGAQLYSNGWAMHADFRQPLGTEGKYGVLKLALAYGESDHPRRSPDRGGLDKSYGGRVTYSLPLQVACTHRFDFLMFVDNSNYVSSVRELNGRGMAMGVGIRLGSEWWGASSGSTPENEGSSTTSPGDLGPPRPRP